MLPAVVLAAGYSTRMGTPKAVLLTPDGRPFVVAVLRALAAAGVQPIAVVTGRDHEAIVAAIARDESIAQPRIVRNVDPSRGQLSSLWTGMDAVLTDAAEGLMMTLVDVPLVEAATVARVVQAWRDTRAPIVRPAIGARHGHPVIFDRTVFAELRAAPLEAGAKTVVRAHASGILDVPVADEGCLVDVDTQEEYRELEKWRSGRAEEWKPGRPKVGK